MKIVHFAISPLAGAPVRLVRALDNCPDIDARMVDLERWGLFDHDLVADEEAELICELAQNADIIHLHNTITLDEDRFEGLNFRSLLASGKTIVRQFHSPRSVVAKYMKVDQQKLADGKTDGVPSLVVAQYHERQFPSARVVPNIIDCPHSPDQKPPALDICFGYAESYAGVGAWDERWATKGAPQINKILKRINRARANSLRMSILCNVAHEQMLLARSNARIVLDELVSGSYHISALEALAAGRATLAFLDQRCLSVLAAITGSANCPFINTPLEHAESVITALLDEPDAADEIGAMGRKWFEEYYRPEILVDHYRQAYRILLEQPDKFDRQSELTISSAGSLFMASKLGDAIHNSRKKIARGGLINTLLNSWAAL